MDKVLNNNIVYFVTSYFLTILAFFFLKLYKVIRVFLAIEFMPNQVLFHVVLFTVCFIYFLCNQKKSLKLIEALLIGLSIGIVSQILAYLGTSFFIEHGFDKLLTTMRNSGIFFIFDIVILTFSLFSWLFGMLIFLFVFLFQRIRTKGIDRQ